MNALLLASKPIKKLKKFREASENSCFVKEDFVAIQTGKREHARAQVRLFKGTGKIIINGRSVENYFPRKLHQKFVQAPLDAVGNHNYDIWVVAEGGGLSGQAQAISLGLSRSLCYTPNEEAYRPALRTQGLLTRDARVVESKRYGKHKARKGTQFSKR